MNCAEERHTAEQSQTSHKTVWNKLTIVVVDRNVSPIQTTSNQHICETIHKCQLLALSASSQIHTHTAHVSLFTNSNGLVQGLNSRHIISICLVLIEFFSLFHRNKTTRKCFKDGFRDIY